VFVNAKANANSRNLVADWYSASSWPISSSDYALNPAGSALGGAQIASLATGAYNSLTLGNLGSISLTGQTGLRLQVSGGQPSGDNYVQMGTYEDGNGRPQLVVTYTVGG
jgi:hypothetical protein